MSIEKQISTKALESGLVIMQEPGAELGELELIADLRALGKITQPAANVDVYAPGIEEIVNAARDFFQAHRAEPCVLEVIAE